MRQDSFVWSSAVFTPPTRQFLSRLDPVSMSPRLRVDGVNTTADKTRQLCLVSNCVYTTKLHQLDKTRQFCLVKGGEWEDGRDEGTGEEEM